VFHLKGPSSWLLSRRKNFAILCGKKKYPFNLTMTQEEIMTYVRSKGGGFAFSASDLPNYGSRTMVDKTLCLMAKAGKIRRVMRGVYDVPRWSEMLRKQAAPDIESVANALARKFGWQIYPGDEGAMNGLGLSTQIPARLIYHSTGPSKTYKVGRLTIEFVHRCFRETEVDGQDARMVVRALKGLGKAYATPEIVMNVAKRFSDEEWIRICESSQWVSSWIKDLINSERERRALVSADR